MIETPDSWVFIRASGKQYGTVDKILCSWYGGYARSDCWKFSSGIVSIQDLGLHYKSPQVSGTIYMLTRSCEGMSRIMHTQFDRLKSMIDPSEGSIVVIPSEDLIKEYGL